MATLPEVGADRPALLGGLLATCLTAPHLLGPLLARPLDRARDGRGLLAAAFATYAGAVALAALLLGRVPVGVPAALLIVAGACGPLLTGGLSSRLAALLAPDERAQRRGQGWDAVTYGVGGSAVPALVAVLAAVAGPRMSLLGLAAATVVAAVLVGTLPARVPGRHGTARTVPAARGGLRVLLGPGPLRRVTGVTMVGALTGGAISVLAVMLAADLGREAASGALLAAAYGGGNLVAALLVTAFPLTGEPERLTFRWAALGAVAVALCAAVPGFPVGVASLGAGLAGVLAPLGPRLLLVAGASVTLAATAGATVSRRRRDAA
ncbi:MFS transporter [Micromonospora sp. NBC_00617]|uniref:MFS transporter n=1 Tax=Micromonospora sp. NBC_00617 TaxID=2903587 RepID=UPI0030E26EB5